MHDYQLERLNTRSFEQLIQALGIEIIGPQLMVFGDGPDGGREATFDGPVAYPAGKKAWDGYGIVQAKFRQVPDSVAKKNADWVIAQLKAEFKKLEPRRGQLPFHPNRSVCPEYYIFATNLNLSSVANKGGKDRVKAVLEGFKKSHGLKDYAIWDGTQIRPFLDTYPGIRTTYTAWLLPGDVLAEMMETLELEKTDFPSTIRRYLECELLDDQFASLGQGGYTEAKNISLASVFVDLPVDLPARGNADESEEEDGENGFLSLLLEEGRQVLKPSMQPYRRNAIGPKPEPAGRITLVGGPGQGKTTVGRFACQLLRAALLRASGGAFSPEVEQALSRIEEMSDGLPRVCARRYPLRVDLKKLAVALATPGAEGAANLFDYLAKVIAARTNSTVKPAELRAWLGAYPWMLVLDGLDEAPASSNRQEVMQAIRDFIRVEAHEADRKSAPCEISAPRKYWTWPGIAVILGGIQVFPKKKDSSHAREAEKEGSCKEEGRHCRRSLRLSSFRRR
ncbi:MAG: hypothetical protein ACI9VS_003643 [Candidatus Binatia bacterium]|jgi:hypothetical protein